MQKELSTLVREQIRDWLACIHSLCAFTSEISICITLHVLIVYYLVLCIMRHKLHKVCFRLLMPEVQVIDKDLTLYIRAKKAILPSKSGKNRKFKYLQEIKTIETPKL